LIDGCQRSPAELWVDTMLHPFAWFTEETAATNILDNTTESQLALNSAGGPLFN
jgi:hypothetical protein